MQRQGCLLCAFMCCNTANLCTSTGRNVFGYDFDGIVIASDTDVAYTLYMRKIANLYVVICKQKHLAYFGKLLRNIQIQLSPVCDLPRRTLHSNVD